ncbi:MAG TPA: hypothetical protein VFV86_01395 [Nitrososphaeraceae archaeon]|nr:hypothetical protein [Nitrososphaeraceae archaeon]
MRSREDEKLQRGLIITDDIYPAPIPNFDKYQSAIIKIIKESYPKFFISIYGDWAVVENLLCCNPYISSSKKKMKLKMQQNKIPLPSKYDKLIISLKSACGQDFDLDKVR